MKGAYLGVSIGSPYYTRNIIESYVSWAKVNCDKFAFLVSDSIYRHTYFARKDIRLVECSHLANKKGVEVVNRIKNALTEGIDIPIKVFRSLELEHHKQFRIAEEVGIETYENSEEFRESIRDDIYSNLGRSENIFLCSDHNCEHVKCRTLSRYVIAEMALLILMSEYMGYEIEVYPGKDIKTIEDVYNHKYRLYNDILPTETLREFVNLKLDD